MRKLILATGLAAALAGPAVADTYPVSGRFAVGTFPPDETIACAGQRVIAFLGVERSDSRGGVPAYRNNWVRQEGEGRYRVSDWFSNGQVRNGQVFYDLLVLDANHLQMNLDFGGTLRLQRCR
jgi:hypothetical protein